jgi:hypothetical protein
MQSCLRPLCAVDERLLALMGSTNKVPICLSGCEAFDFGWVVLVPGLTVSPSHRVVLTSWLFLKVPAFQFVLGGKLWRVSVLVDIAACHDRPNDTRYFVRERDGGHAHRFARQ